MTDKSLLGIEEWLLGIDVTINTDGHKVDASTNSESTEVKVDKEGNATKVNDPTPESDLPDVETQPTNAPEFMDGYWWMELSHTLSNLSLLDQTIKYINTRGVDRAFLTLLNEDVSKLCNFSFPSAENYDVVGSPKSIISLEALNALNAASGVQRSLANKSMQAISGFALQVASWLISKTSEIAKSSNQILKAATVNKTVVNANTPDQAALQVAQVTAQRASTVSTSAPTVNNVNPQRQSNATGPDSNQIQQKISSLLTSLQNAPTEINAITNRLINLSKTSQSDRVVTQAQAQRTVANTPTKVPGSENWSMAAGGVLTPSGGAVTGQNVVGTTRQYTKSNINSTSAQNLRKSFMDGINQVPLANIKQMVPKNIEFLNQTCKSLRTAASGFKSVGNNLAKINNIMGGDSQKIVSDLKLKLKTVYQQYIQVLKGASMLLKSSAESLKA